MLLVSLKLGAVATFEHTVHIAVFEGLDRIDLAVHIVSDHLKTAQNKRLAHYVQVLAQRIDNLDAG